MRCAVSPCDRGDSATVVELRLPPPHAAWALVELGPPRAEDENRQARRPVDEPLDEREQRVVRPVQIFEEQDEGPIGGDGLDEPLPGARRLLAIGLATPGEAHKRPQAVLQPLRVVGSGDGHAELRGGFGGRVRLEDPGVGLDDLAERPEGDAVAVREAAALAPVHELGAVVHPGPELREQARLADARLTGDRDELDLRLADHALEGVLQQAQLAAAADERCRRRRLGVDAEAARRRKRVPGGNGIALALELERGKLLVADRLPRRPVRLLVDDEASDGRLSLQTGGDVDDVTRGDSLARSGLGAKLHDRLSSRDGRAHREVELLVLRELVDRLRGSAAPRARRAPDRPRAPRVLRRPPSRHRRRTSRRCRRTARSRARRAGGMGGAWRGRPPGRRGRRLP